ncbi:MAG: PSD1 domain-containing protein [Verrucomicrobia bacterium]|nr:PSD1 domain-containing protein [Verrucomicrobiota bacterium]
MKSVWPALVVRAVVAGLGLPGVVQAAIDVAKLPPAASGSVPFSQQIQPLLAERCYSCHGEKKQESGLRLDQRDAALRGGDHGALLVPGRSDDSLLVAVLAGAHSDVAAMPKKGEKLSPEQVGLIRAWIDQGADWPVTATVQNDARLDHWAWKAPVRPPLPATAPVGANPIDAFVRSRLAQEGLKPSPAADRTTLLRRLHFDLIGLPPTPEEVDAFLTDSRPDAYSRKVEELLKSPHYGERWGRHWLDAARYADSDGFEKDKPRFVWAYRDWVVNAFNRDLPYDQFVVEQISGDLLPNATDDQRVATGFLRNSMLNEEGGVDPEQFRTDGLIDRMDALGKSVLGITIQCSQCHNHKFDPISQEEYYRLFAFLNNDHESSRVYYPPEQQLLVGNLTRQIRDLEEGLRHVTPDWMSRMQAWEDSVAGSTNAWQVVETRNTGDNGERFYHYADGSVRAASYAPTFWTANFRGTNQLPVIGAFRLEQLPDPNLPCGGPGRSIKGMSALSEFGVEAIDAANPTNKLKVKFVKATADFANAERPLEPEFQSESRNKKDGDKRTYGPVEHAIDGKDDTAWGIDAGPGRRNVARQAVFVPEKPLEFPQGVILQFQLHQKHGGDNSDDNQNHNLGRWRLSVCADTNAVADVVPTNVRLILGIPREQRTPLQVATVFSYWRTLVPEFKETNDRIEALWRQWPEGTPTQTLARRTGQGPGEELRPTPIFKRGDWLKPGKEVTFGTPAFLHPLPANADDSRLTLARWLTDKKSPTTARVAVNRVWQSYFGTGLLETPEDFGVQSPAPSHPELLDWLACEFMDQGWSFKALHRLIVSSDTYRQSSRVTPELWERDPYNRLLARGPRLRVEGEIVRDTALAASGLLNPQLGGRSVYPPAPEFLFQPPASYGPKVWIEEKGSDRFRRSLYVFRFRSVPYPVLMNFDAPNGDFSCVRRVRSNTPLQALTTLNETQFMEAAQGLAAKTLREGGRTDDERLRFAFRRVLSRPPTATELAELQGLLERQRQRIADGWVNPFELATGRNELPTVPAGTTPTQLAAYTVVSRALLNLDEAITKE